jgi:hypothetical protein
MKEVLSGSRVAISAFYVHSMVPGYPAGSTFFPFLLHSATETMRRLMLRPSCVRCCQVHHRRRVTANGKMVRCTFATILITLHVVISDGTTVTVTVTLTLTLGS